MILVRTARVDVRSSELLSPFLKGTLFLALLISKKYSISTHSSFDTFNI